MSTMSLYFISISDRFNLPKNPKDNKSISTFLRVSSIGKILKIFTLVKNVPIRSIYSNSSFKSFCNPIYFVIVCLAGIFGHVAP